MVTFIVVPLVAGFCALLFSKLDILIRGDRAREPIFKFAQPQEKKETQLDNEDESEEHAAPASDKEYEEFESHIYGGGTESDNMKDETDLAEDKNSQSVDVAA